MARPCRSWIAFGRSIGEPPRTRVLHGCCAQALGEDGSELLEPVDVVRLSRRARRSIRGSGRNRCCKLSVPGPKRIFPAED